MCYTALVLQHLAGIAPAHFIEIKNDYFIERSGLIRILFTLLCLD